MTAYEVIAASRVAAGAEGLTAAVAVAGQSLTIRNTELTNKVALAGLWGQGVALTDVRVRSPRMADNVNGVRFLQVAGNAQDLLPGDIDTPVIPQDTLMVEQAHSGAGTGITCLKIRYDRLEGADGRFSTWDQVKPRIVALTTNELTITGAAAAAWSAGTAFAAGSWAPDPNTDYAVLGYEVGTQVAAVSIAGTDTGNLFVGGPGTADFEFTRDYFKRYSQESGHPAIPVINSANNSTLLARTVAELATAPVLSFLLAQLG